VLYIVHCFWNSIQDLTRSSSVPVWNEEELFDG